MTAGQYGAALAASMATHPTQEGRAVTDPSTIQDPEPFRVPSTGFLLEYDSQVYEVQKTATHVDLQRDPKGREQHTLDIRIQAVWTEDGYHQPGLDGLL
jgi:hypothetical protein